MTYAEYQIECITRDLTTYLVKDFSFDLECALRTVYNSKTYEKLCNTQTGLYLQSTLYVYGFLKSEIKTRKLQQAEK